ENGENGENSSGESRAVEKLRNAQERMENAQEKMNKAQKSQSVEEQQKALRELEEAKAELEEALRQLREEEAKRYLTMLDARLKKIQELQRKVYDDTCRLDGLDASRSSEVAVEASRLSRREQEIILETQKALLLLHEEGSTKMLPDVLEQVLDDMRSVSQLLASGRVDTLTQSTQEDILAALEEMLEALELAEQKLEESQAEGGQEASPADGDPALVDMIAELKMIRSAQVRIHKRTEKVSQLSDTATMEEKRTILGDLSKRQERLRKIVHDFATETKR
ncbi:MAG: hypothetical protein Q4D38_11370, partial [Planctomycetia bacterium]|nr:hypothetical protein [Planctomycetia bacterium]